MTEPLVRVVSFNGTVWWVQPQHAAYYTQLRTTEVGWSNDAFRASQAGYDAWHAARS